MSRKIFFQCIFSLNYNNLFTYILFLFPLSLALSVSLSLILNVLWETKQKIWWLFIWAIQNKTNQAVADCFCLFIYTFCCCCFCCFFFYFVIIMAVCICCLQNFVFKTSAFEMLELLECDVFKSVAVCTYLQWVVCPDWIKNKKIWYFFWWFYRKETK